MPLIVVLIIVIGRKRKSINHNGKTRKPPMLLFSIFVPNLIMTAGYFKVMNIPANFKDGYSSKYMLPDRTSEKQIGKRGTEDPFL